MFPQFLFLVFSLLLAVVSAGKLGIKLDENLAPPMDGKYRSRDGGWYLWSSYIKVKKTPNKGNSLRWRATLMPRLSLQESKKALAGTGCPTSWWPWLWMMRCSFRRRSRKGAPTCTSTTAATSKGLIDPCGTDARMGCRDLVGVKELNFDAVTADVKTEDYESIFVKVAGQQELAKKEVSKPKDGQNEGGKGKGEGKGRKKQARKFEV